MELRTVEQLSEDRFDLRSNDAWSVVPDRQLESRFVLLEQLHGDVGKNAGLFAGVKSVVHGLLDRRQQRRRRQQLEETKIAGMFNLIFKYCRLPLRSFLNIRY